MIHPDNPVITTIKELRKKGLLAEDKPFKPYPEDRQDSKTTKPEKETK